MFDVSGTEEMAWLDDAACAKATTNPKKMLDVFFLEGYREEAQKLCASCPVQAECRSHAFDRGLSHGFFGGLTAADRSRADAEVLA